jgi:hypothetical protein
MNWMIDGAYGDLYRQAMGHPLQDGCLDEWETERRMGRARRASRTTPAAPGRRRTLVIGWLIAAASLGMRKGA